MLLRAKTYRRPSCEVLESREMPASNLMGINLSGVEDWSTDRMFADAMKSARRPSAFGSHEGTPPIDSKGWPATDASIVVWHGISSMNGTYRLSFTGQADITTSWGAATILNKVYKSSTNTTTADIFYLPTDGSGLLLNFKNTKRTAGSALNSGITNIKMMRPISPGSTTSYDTSATFTTPLKNLVSNFSVVRMMDNTGSNGGSELTGDWDDRREKDYASQAAKGTSQGMAWEYAIQFWNETDKDAWVNIPFTADDEYITQLAKLLKNNLEAGRKIYVEYSNELWNTWGVFPGVDNRDAAIAEVQANPSSPLNFDNIYPAIDTQGWELAKRRIALRSVQVSDIFRQVFGGSQMMSRIRPVLMSQLGWTEGWLAGELDYLEDYFNNAAYRSTPRAPSYYLYGAGGSAYEDPKWSIGSGITVDQIFATMPYNFEQNVKKDMDWVAAFGLKRIAYEGGPSLDNITSNTGVPTSTLDSAWADSRMRTEIVQNQNTWSAAGGDLLMYFASTGGAQWGMVKDTFSLDTQKMRAIGDLNVATAASVTYGKLAPSDLISADFRIPYYQGYISSMQSSSLTKNWNGAAFRIDTSGKYAIQLTTTDSVGGKVEIYIDGKSFGIVSLPSSGVTGAIALETLEPGIHGVVLKARAGSFGIAMVSIVSTSSPPPTPTSAAASVLSSMAIRVNWKDEANNETQYSVERATNSGFSAGFVSFALPANSNQYTDGGLISNTTYFYRVRASNAAGYSAYSNVVSGTTTGSTGVTAQIFDNANLTGAMVARTDGDVDFYWPGSPATGIGQDTFSVRWTGRVAALENGSYQFRTYTDDGVRLWVNNQLVVDNWTNHAGMYDTSSTISLAAGQKYDIRMEFFDNTGGAVTRLEWRRPGQTQFAVIPEQQLTPFAGGPVLFADSFSSGLGNWGPVSGSWGMVSQYAGRSAVSSTTSSSESVSLAATASWSDYSMTAWVNLSNLSGAIGILGRVVDSTHYYQLELRRNSSNQMSWFLNARDGASWIQLKSGTISYTANTWLQLRLTMIGTSLAAEASTNGTAFTTLGTVTDNRYLSGRVGLRAANSAAYFDDVVVQGV